MSYIAVILVSNVLTLTVESTVEIFSNSDTLVKGSNYPSFGSCWTNSMRRVKAGCDSLSLESQKYMALSFTDCFLAISGDEAYGCDKSLIREERNKCIQKMTTRDYKTFTDFFRNVDNLCRFLEIQVWQEDTETKVRSLVTSSTKARRTLVEALQKQKISLQLQKMSTSEQVQIIKATSHLDDRLFELQSKTEQTVDTFSKATSGSYGVLLETFAGLSALRQWLANKTSWVETVIFYICAVVIILLLTSLQELEDAKWALFSLLILGVCIECGLWSLSLYLDVWFARNALVYVCAGLLCLSAYRHWGTESANRRIMLEIERNIDHLEKLMLGTRLLHENVECVQNAEVSSPYNRLSITPDKKRASRLKHYDKSWQYVHSSVTPDRTPAGLQEDGDKVIRSSPCRSITPNSVGSEDDLHQQRNTPRILQSSSAQRHSPVDKLYMTRRTRHAGMQSAA